MPYQGDMPMTLEFPEDSQIDELLKMTNNVVMKIKQRSQEML
jgi:hypothetical protein